MEGNGCGGSGCGCGSGSAAPPWDLGMNWQPILPRPGGGGGGHYYQQQQQELTSLKLGKRPCCWAGAAGSQQVSSQAAGEGLLPPHVHGSSGGGDPAAGGGASGTAAGEGRRKEKAGAAAAAAVARCQVEGCHVELTGAKEYHRRHKVCEAHSKAPLVVVLGAEQRFCQQCSRFHAISEFDDAKRSCRRRLAGHNERRRKSNASEAMARGAARPHGMAAFGHAFLAPCGLPAASPAGALSLLSSARGGPWLVPAPEISARSSAALDELIAENRAALLAWPFLSSASDRSSGPGRHPVPPSAAGRALPPPANQTAGWHPHHPGNNSDGGGGDRYYYHAAAAPSAAGHMTLDLMQREATTAAPGGAPEPPFRPVAERAVAVRPPRNKDGDAAGCSSDAWTSSSLGGARAL